MLPALRDSLADSINRHSADLQPVSLQLCIAMSALVLQWTEWEDVLQYLGDCAQVNMLECNAAKPNGSSALLGAGCRLTASNMLLLLEYLPQEPSDPVYGKTLSGSSAYEWEAQSQYRVGVLTSFSKACVTTTRCVYLQENCICHRVDYCTHRFTLLGLFACTAMHAQHCMFCSL